MRAASALGTTIAIRLWHHVRNMPVSEQLLWDWIPPFETGHPISGKKPSQHITVASTPQIRHQCAAVAEAIVALGGVAHASSPHRRSLAVLAQSFFSNPEIPLQSVSVVWVANWTATLGGQLGKQVARGSPEVYPVHEHPSTFRPAPLLTRAIEELDAGSWTLQSPAARMFCLRRSWLVNVREKRRPITIDQVVKAECDPDAIKQLQQDQRGDEAYRLVMTTSSDVFDSPMVGFGVIILSNNRPRYLGMSLFIMPTDASLLRMSSHAVAFEIAWIRFQALGFGESLEAWPPANGIRL